MASFPAVLASILWSGASATMYLMAGDGNDWVIGDNGIDTLFGVTEGAVNVTSSDGDTSVEYGNGNVLTLVGVTDTDAVYDSIDFA